MAVADLFYAALNPMIRGLLRSRAHGLISRHVCLLSYRGRKSGREFHTPLSYYRDGNTVTLLSSTRTRWWHNFATGDYPVELLLSGHTFAGRATLHTAASTELAALVESFLTANPRDAVVYHIGLEGRRPKKSDIEARAGHVIAVKIELTPVRHPTEEDLPSCKDRLVDVSQQAQQDTGNTGRD